MDIDTMLSSGTIGEFTDEGSDAPEKAARFLKSFAHRDRLRILCALINEEMPVAVVEANVGASQSAVSQHLARLRDEGIVKSRRDGRQILYSIADPTVLAMITLLYQRFCSDEPD